MLLVVDMYEVVNDRPSLGVMSSLVVRLLGNCLHDGPDLVIRGTWKSGFHGAATQQKYRQKHEDDLFHQAYRTSKPLNTPEAMA